MGLVALHAALAALLMLASARGIAADVR